MAQARAGKPGTSTQATTTSIAKGKLIIPANAIVQTMPDDQIESIGTGKLLSGLLRNPFSDNDGLWYTYHTTQKITGPLFDHMPERDDIEQGALGCCYLAAIAISIAHLNPLQLVSMMREEVDNNGKPWVTVRLYDTNNQAHYYRVEKTDITPKGVTAKKFHRSAPWFAILLKALGFHLAKLKNMNGEKKDIIGIASTGHPPYEIMQMLLGARGEAQSLLKFSLLNRLEKEFLDFDTKTALEKLQQYRDIIQEELEQNSEAYNSGLPTILDNLKTALEILSKHQQGYVLTEAEIKNYMLYAKKTSTTYTTLFPDHYKSTQYHNHKRIRQDGSNENFEDYLKKLWPALLNFSEHLTESVKMEEGDSNLIKSYDANQESHREKAAPAVYELLREKIDSGCYITATTHADPILFSKKSFAGHRESISGGLADNHEYCIIGISKYALKHISPDTKEIGGFIQIQNPWQHYARVTQIDNEGNILAYSHRKQEVKSDFELRNKRQLGQRQTPSSPLLTNSEATGQESNYSGVSEITITDFIKYFNNITVFKSEDKSALCLNQCRLIVEYLQRQLGAGNNNPIIEQIFNILSSTEKPEDERLIELAQFIYKEKFLCSEEDNIKQITTNPFFAELFLALKPLHQAIKEENPNKQDIINNVIFPLFPKTKERISDFYKIDKFFTSILNYFGKTHSTIYKKYEKIISNETLTIIQRLKKVQEKLEKHQNKWRHRFLRGENFTNMIKDANNVIKKYNSWKETGKNDIDLFKLREFSNSNRYGY